MDASIDQFVERWLQKSQSDQDPFDQFVSAWIALTVIARAHENYGSGKQDVKDCVMIRNLFRDRFRNIARGLDAEGDNLLQLAQRRGTEYRNAIIDSGDAVQRQRNRQFADNVVGGRALTEADLEALGWILTRVRNNLFHGKKMYDKAEDTDLLKIVTPVTQAIIRACWPRPDPL